MLIKIRNWYSQEELCFNAHVVVGERTVCTVELLPDHWVKIKGVIKRARTRHPKSPFYNSSSDTICRNWEVWEQGRWWQADISKGFLVW